MAVISLPKSYGGILSYKNNGKFFEKFNFLDMEQKKKEKGEHDVNTIVFDDSGIQCTDCINICNVSCFRARPPSTAQFLSIMFRSCKVSKKDGLTQYTKSKRWCRMK